MENCYDINDNEISQIILGDDGIVYGIGELESKATLSSECCIAMGYEFDPNLIACYWSKPCENEGGVKILVSPEGEDGVIFQVDENERCSLVIEFDYLFQYECSNLLECKDNNPLLDLITAPIIKATLEKYDLVAPLGDDITYETPYKYITVASETIYEIIDVNEFFTDNMATSIFTAGGRYCTNVFNAIVAELGVDSNILNPSSFNSKWLHFKLTISDEDVLDDIKNKKIKLGIIIENNPCEISVLLDNIEFNRTCVVFENRESVITTNPAFNLTRVTDNKKSWVNSDVVEDREFNLSERETAYNIKHHKLGINTKEVDINISSAAAIESDVMDFILDNPTILGSLSGILTTNIFEVGLTKEKFLSILYSELIDVKDRQTISGYPLLKMIYENYLDSLNMIGVQSSGFKYSDMFKFIDLIGNYWVDLVEQVIPSTTIWGSTYKLSNTIFDNDKFKYKKGTLFTCSPASTPLPIIGDNYVVEVTSEVLVINPIENEPEATISNCYGVYMIQTDDSSEFIGSVKVLGGDLRTSLNEGDIIILNESDSSVLQQIT